MKRKLGAALSVSSFLLLEIAGAKAAMVAYPKQGQSVEQQTQDKAYCAQWATQQTGISPEKLLEQQQAGQAEPSSKSPSAGRSAARGAAAGAAIGGIAGDAGKGAAVGAGTGAVGGGARRRREEKEQQQKQQAGQQQLQQQMEKYNSAQKACLEGRGYSVS